MLERPQSHEEDGSNSDSPTDLPEMRLAPAGVSNIRDVHAPVACQRAHGEEDDGHSREDEDGSVLVVGDDCKIVLFEGAEFVDLQRMTKIVRTSSRSVARKVSHTALREEFASISNRSYTSSWSLVLRIAARTCSCIDGLSAWSGSQPFAKSSVSKFSTSFRRLVNTFVRFRNKIPIRVSSSMQIRWSLTRSAGSWRFWRLN